MSAAMFAAMTQPQLTCQDFEGRFRRSMALAAPYADGLHDGALTVGHVGALRWSTLTAPGRRSAISEIWPTTLGSMREWWSIPANTAPHAGAPQGGSVGSRGSVRERQRVRRAVGG